jgi:hypothetical protein
MTKRTFFLGRCKSRTAGIVFKEGNPGARLVLEREKNPVPPVWGPGANPAVTAKGSKK